MSVLFLDESKTKGYTVSAVAISTPNIVSVRRRVAELRLKGQRRIHFTKESDRRRRTILSTMTSLRVTAHIYSLGSCLSDEEGRRRCLTALVDDAATLGVSRIVLEQDDSVIAFDRQVLALELASRDNKSVTYRHERAASEPLLWIADAVAWSYTRGGEWRERASPLIHSVKEVPL